MGIFRNKKITSLSFLDLNEEKFRNVSFILGLATLLAKEVKTFKEKLKHVFSSYLSLSEVLVEYDFNSDDIDSIPLFEPQIHEIQDDNEIFKRYMKEILGRLRLYKTLQPDSLELCVMSIS